MKKLLLLALLFSCGTNDSEKRSKMDGTAISEETFSGEWPFTVASGELLCSGNKVIFTSNGKKYGLNGLARGDKSLAEVDEIWKDDPDIPGAKVNIGDMISAGLELCK